MTSNELTQTPIDAYIAMFPTEVQQLLQSVRSAIKEAAPDAEEAIKYKLPTFVLKKKNLVHFGAFKNHIGFYPDPAGIEQFRDELAPYINSKGGVQFPLNQSIPSTLIKKIVTFRIQEIHNRLQ